MTRTHDRVVELLPWLVNETLTRAEEAEVRRHLSNCVTCREQLEQLEELSDTVREAPRLQTNPVAALDSMRQRLEQESEVESSGMRPRSSPLVRWILLAQAAALVFALGLLLLQRTASPWPSPPFRTLTESSAPITAGAPRARLMFAESSTEREIRQLLHQVGARVVDGPSEKGVYTVELEVETRDPATIAGRVEALRQDRNVRFVELVSPGPATRSSD
jgi:anti-sigma factor RsiW